MYNTYDFEKFQTNNRPLIVIGLSGSGKTTLCRKILKKKTVRYFSEDKLFKKEFGKKFLYKGPFLEEENMKKIEKFIMELFQKNNKFIYDGLRIVNFFNFNEEQAKSIFKDCSFILLKTDIELCSKRKAATNRIPRNSTFEKRYNRKLKQNEIWYKYLFDLERWLDSDVKKNKKEYSEISDLFLSWETL